MASLSEIQEALTNADAAGRTEDANKLADLYIKMQNETPKTDPNEAGVENLFGDDNGILGDVGNVGARVLAQPAYEGLVTANVLAEAPAFVAGPLNQIWNSIDFYFDDDFNDVYKEQNLKDRTLLADEISKKIENNEPYPSEWNTILKNLDDTKDDGISYAESSRLAKVRRDEIVEDIFDKGVLLDGAVNNSIETLVEDPEQQKQTKAIFEKLKKDIEESDIIPSAETAFNETITGNMLKGFGYLIEGAATALSAVGIPEETAQSLTELASLFLGRPFSKLNAKAKEVSQYTPIRNRIASSAQKVFWQTDKRKAEQAITKSERNLQKMKDKGASKESIEKAEIKLDEFKKTINNSQYGILENAKMVQAWDSKLFTKEDLDAFNVYNFDKMNNPNSKVRKRDSTVPDTKKGLETFKESNLQVSKSNYKADLTAGEVLATRIGNLFGAANGWGKDRTFTKKTEKQ